jgi:hypothetical protein
MSNFNNYTLAGSLNEQVKPTHLVTIILNEGISENAVDGSRRWIRGDDPNYNRAFLAYIKSVAKEAVSKNCWQRHKPRLASVGSIEGDGSNQQHHLHLAIRKPEHLSEQRFEDILRHKARRNRWFKSGPNAIDIRTLPTQIDGHQAIGYSLKKGIDRLLYS